MSRRIWAQTCLVVVLIVWPAAAGDVLHPGAGKQLFLDDACVESSKHFSRVCHQPRRCADNPILRGTEPWERWLVEANGRPVLFDEETRELKMWYGAPLLDSTAPAGIRFRVCYATSRDGLHWEKPQLLQVDWDGARANNLLKWGENWMRRPNVLQDRADPDPERRFKMTYVDVLNKQTALCKAYSPDGVHWQLNGDGKPWFRSEHNANVLGWEPSRRQYVLYIRQPGARNAVGRSTSKDFITWSEPKTVLAPGPEERETDFKGLAAFLYGDVYLGWLWLFKDRRTAQAELVHSRDGIAWQRQTGKSLFPRGEQGSWDSQWILPVAPVVFKDAIWIYYTGSNLPYDKESMIRARKGWIEKGQRMQTAIGLATLRLDGFVSLRAGQQSGRLTTRLLEIPGGTLCLNAAVRGELRVEVLDKMNRPVPGHSLQDCDVIKTDRVRHLVCWKGKSNLADLRGKQVRLRVLLQDGDLFAYWFQAKG